MIHDAVCLETKLLVPNAKLEEVTETCEKMLREMGLKVMKTEKTSDGTTTVLAGERAFVPLTLRTLLYPFSLQQYIKAAHRSGVHVVISPSGKGVIVYSCGLALDELTGKPAKFISDEAVEEVTNTMEALDFENKFLKKLKQVFPETKETEQ